MKSNFAKDSQILGHILKGTEANCPAERHLNDIARNGGSQCGLVNPTSYSVQSL